jgi:hypothetical protein
MPKKAIAPDAKVREVVRQGIQNLGDVQHLLVATIQDVLAGRVSPAAANKLTRETGKLLKKLR